MRRDGSEEADVVAFGVCVEQSHTMDLHLIETLTNGGALVASVAALAWYVLRRETRFEQERQVYQNEIQRVQEARVDDAQKTADRLLTITDRWHALIQEQTAVMSSLEDKIVSAQEKKS